MRHHRRVKLALQLGLSAIVCLVLALPAQAALIGLKPTFPDLLANTSGSYSYDKESELFTITAEPRTLTYSLSDYDYIYTSNNTKYSGQKSYAVNINIDNSGNFKHWLGGDLQIIGKVGDGTSYDGLLLTGEVTGFGYGDPILLPTGQYQIFDFTFQITGGDLAVLFGGIGSSGGAIALSESSTFDGDWNENFDGQFTKADNFPIPIPAAAWLFASGLIGLVVIRRGTKR